MISGRRGARRGLLAIGWAYVGVGLLFYLLTVVTAWWLATGFGQRDPRGRDLSQGFLAVAGSLDAVLLLGLGVVLVGIGGLTLYDAGQLGQARLVIGHHGIAWAGQPWVRVPWDRIRHVAVTNGQPGWRRLLVDDGRMPADWWLAAKIYPGRAQLRLLARRRRFLVNLPIDRLDVAATDVIRAIRHHSGGRFPDQGRQDLDQSSLDGRVGLPVVPNRGG